MDDSMKYAHMNETGEMKAQVQKKPMIQAKFDQTTVCLDSLEKSVMVLLEKIEPIVGPAQIELSMDTDEDSEEMGQLARSLENNIDRILALDRIINRTLRRLEI